MQTKRHKYGGVRDAIREATRYAAQPISGRQGTKRVWRSSRMEVRFTPVNSYDDHNPNGVITIESIGPTPAA